MPRPRRMLALGLFVGVAAGVCWPSIWWLFPDSHSMLPQESDVTFSGSCYTVRYPCSDLGLIEQVIAGSPSDYVVLVNEGRPFQTTYQALAHGGATTPDLISVKLRGPDGVMSGEDILAYIQIGSPPRYELKYVALRLQNMHQQGNWTKNYDYNADGYIDMIAEALPTVEDRYELVGKDTILRASKKPGIVRSRSFHLPAIQ